MARIRSIKPDFWTSEQVMECSPIARLMFIGMWNFADDHGRMPAAPKTIKAQIFPADDIDSATIRRMIDELSANGLVQVYVVDEKEFLFITGWRHQKIDKRQPAKYPEPPAQHSSNGRRTVSTDLRGSEGIGGDRKGSKTRASAIDDGWPDDFGDQFWQAYPRKTDKLAAMKKLASVRKQAIVTWPDLMAGVQRYAAVPRDPQYTKQPATWLNAGCWADEIQTGGDHGNRTGNPRQTGHDALLAVQARKALALDRDDAMAGSAGEVRHSDSAERGRSERSEGLSGGDRRGDDRIKSHASGVFEGEVISPDEDAPGHAGGRLIV